MDILCNYAAYRRCVPILVFDAYKVKGGAGEVEQYHQPVRGVHQRGGNRGYVHRKGHPSPGKHYHTRVVTRWYGAADHPGSGCAAGVFPGFQVEVREAEKEIRQILETQFIS